MSRFELLIIGSLCNVDVAVAEALTERGFDCRIARSPDNPVEFDHLPAEVRYVTKESVVEFRSSWELMRLCRRSSAVVGVSIGSILSLKLFWVFGRIVRLPPLVTVMTGADFTEAAVERSVLGVLIRTVLRRAALIWLNPYPHALRNVAALGLHSYAFLRLPWLLPEPGASAERTGSILYLHATNLDWGMTDCGSHRNSTKGSDRFIRAFLRALDEGADIRCLILDRGPDKDLAKQMIAESGKSDAFEWRPETTQAGLRELILEADIVADQFDIGAFGASSMEAMAQGKPVMTWLAEVYEKILYHETPPIIKCKTEDEILQAILSHQERSALQSMGRESLRWVTANHRDFPDGEEVAFRIRALMDE